MAAYAVIARIGRVDPHLTVRDLERDLDDGDPPDRGLPIDGSAVAIDLRDPDPGPIAERVTRLRELWTQTTFYLFDADSWRS